jgi:Cephalosporin hydroxylase
MAVESPKHIPGLLSADDRDRHAITAGLRANEELIFKFAKAWYASNYTFRATTVLGYPACKIPLDLWIMHDLFCQYRFVHVIETGTAGGGTTLWYAMLMDMLGIEGGRIWSIDVDDAPEGALRPEHPRITYVKGSSTDLAIVESITNKIRFRRGHFAGATLVNLDSSHFATHVVEELRVWAPLLEVNDWFVVEDTNGVPVMDDPRTGTQVEVEGPFAAVMEFMAKHPGEFSREVVCERYWLTMCPHGFLQRHARCDH